MKYNFTFNSLTAKIFVLSFLMMAVSIPVSAQNDESNKKYKAIDMAEFMDSAHHWYDITDKDEIIKALPDKPKYNLSEITKIADNILLFQRNNGGWMKNYDMRAILTEAQKKALIETKDNDQTTFDNGTTYSQIEYLAKVYSVTKENKYKDAAIKGLEFILKAQYPNGGWPQFYPDTSGYRKYITFNDGAMIGNMNLLHQVVQNKSYFSFVDNALKAKINDAFNKGVDCILKCQVKEDGGLTAWCQQNDMIDFHPQGARTFELPSVCAGESSEITLFLMSLEHPDNRVINSVQSAIKWFDKSQIHGVKVETIKAPKVTYKYRTTSSDRVVVNDPNAPRIWARFYELGTNKPFFSDRNGKPVYSLAEVGRERRDGYGWYTYDPEEVLKEYTVWQKKLAKDDDVLKK